MQKYFSGFVLVGVLIAAALIFGPFGLGLDSDCRNTVLREQPSPDGKRIAVLFDRFCGANTDRSHQVSILAPGERPRGGGNAFVSDDNHGAAPRRDGSYVALRWLSPKDLLIAYEARARTFKKADQVDGVSIVYNAARDDPGPR
jgi:hypothetical protein